MKITITLDVPDGTTYQIGGVAVAAEAQYVPPFEDELIPLPEGATPIPSDPVPFRGAANGPIETGRCPVHHEPWKMVPAGISKRTGKRYSAFAACPVQGCTQRPAA